MIDIVENNPFTIIFQNDCRPKSGKFGVPLSSELMIKSLINTALNLKKLSIDIKIVPVSINYEFVIDNELEYNQTSNRAINPNIGLMDLMK